MDKCTSLPLVTKRASMLADMRSHSLATGRAVKGAALSYAFAAKQALQAIYCLVIVLMQYLVTV